jgi:hypothetical protein
MSVRWQIEKHFTDAAKTLVNAVTSQALGPFDNTTKVRPRIEVDFLPGEQESGTTMQNSNAAWYDARFDGTLEVTVCTAHTDANHANYVGTVRELFASNSNAIVANTNTHYEVQDVRHESTERERDDNEDELRTRMRYRVPFAVKPW